MSVPPPKDDGPQPNLAAVHSALDEIDGRILDALAERHRWVLEVARIKSDGQGRIRDPLREEDVLTRLVERGRQAGLDGWFVTRLFREVLEQSLRVQEEHIAELRDPSRGAERTLVVAYQGGEGAYSHMTAMRHFGTRKADVVYQGYDTFREMLEAVRSGEADYGVLPIENTTAGSINESYDLLARMDLALVGEEIARVVHCLVAVEEVPLSHIRRVYSHPQALAQCSDFLSTLHNCKVEAFKDTALAVAKIKEEQDLSQAAIASEQAAQLHGLPILKRDIANQKQNYTRMVVVAREPVHFGERVACKTSLIFATRHEEGALAKCVNLFAEHKLNLTKLESRPRPNTPWEYLFYVDFEGNVEDEQVKGALRELASRTSFLKVLGSYPGRTTKDARPAEPRRVTGTEPQRTSRPPLEAEGTRSDVLRALEKKAYRLVTRANRREDTRIPLGAAIFGDEVPVIIAGPCAVESREQIRACARAAKDAGADLLRGGCFKPASGLGAFSGFGYEGLDWLEEAGREVGLPIVTEVLHPADVGKVARKADIIQIRADNMQNFALLKEVGQTDRPVLLKRGMMASIDEWLEAAEFILSQGNQQVILCERGIRTFESRTTLDLSAIPVVQEISHLPVIVDTSHGVGERRFVPQMTGAALAAGAHGVMIEIAPEPPAAKFGGTQMLDFAEFTRLMQRLGRRPTND